VLGGTQSLHCNGRDEALGLPTEDSATIALRTQQILLHETGVAHTVDPTAGSYTVEMLTNRIEEEARALIERIHAAGGVLAAVESGYIQQQIQEAAYATQQAIDGGDMVVVGVNRYVAQDNAQAPTIEPFRIDPEIERGQIERVRAVRASRSRDAWQAALAQVETAAQDGSNLVPPIIAAVEARATLGEIADAMRRVFGEHQET
jgi:methylmalonyl-CoA mutase N-terminal domain/subunit